MTPQTIDPTDTKFDNKAAELVTKAVTAIVLDDPFYGYLLLRQDLVQDPTTKTACTNGKVLRYSAKFVRNMTFSQLKGLLKHEVMHVAHMHHLRRGGREAQKWNMACDYVINDLLKSNGVDLPEGGLYNPAYKDMSSEHVYNLIPDQDGDGPGEGPRTRNGKYPAPWNFGEFEDGDFDSEDERQQLEDDARLDVINAHNTAKIMGKVPAEVERLVESIKQSKLPWRKILARLFKSIAKDDESWSRPNRRYLAHDLYLPSLHSEALGPLVIGVDTSGSVAGKELEAFFGCINGILKQTKPEAIHVVYCDAAVANTQVFKPSDYPIKSNKFKPKGGGGTDFRPVFDYVAKKKLKPVALLYLTDMYGTFPDKAPKYPTIWCATSTIQAPFGKTLAIEA